jgi:DNA uptake protein ComE-like DNA-binding protein
MANKKFKHKLREYLTFTRIERNGIIVLLFLILVTIVIKATNPFNKTVQYKKHSSQITKLFNVAVKVDSINRKTTNYLESNVLSNPKYRNGEKKSYKYHIVEINSTDSANLEKLPGIGPVLSGRIVKYRNKLGGFYKKEQLLEVFGLKVENYKQCEGYLKTDTFSIKRIALNTATFKEINAHPYISYEQTKAIFKARNKGNVVDFNFIIENKLFDSTEIKKVLPYLNFIK